MILLAVLLSIGADIQRIASRIDSIVGVSAVNLKTGQRVDVRASERFPMGSVYKFPIAIEVLLQIDAGRVDPKSRITIEPKDFSPGRSPVRDNAGGKPVTMTVDALLESMLGDSDNTATDALLRLVTPAAVTKRMVALGVSGVRVDRSEKTIMADIDERGATHYAHDPRDTATPSGMVTLLSRVASREAGLSDSSHERMLAIMTASPRNRIKVKLPRDVSVAHKSGQMPGTRNDVGLITAGDTTIAIAIFTRAGRKSTDDQRAEVISDIARRVFEQLVPVYRER